MEGMRYDGVSNRSGFVSFGGRTIPKSSSAVYGIWVLDFGGVDLGPWGLGTSVGQAATHLTMVCSERVLCKRRNVLFTRQRMDNKPKDLHKTRASNS